MSSFVSCWYSSRGRTHCSKIDFKVKYIRVKICVNEINCKKSLTYNKVYGRRLSKLFTNCHVSWDTLFLFSTILDYRLYHALTFLLSPDQPSENAGRSQGKGNSQGWWTNQGQECSSWKGKNSLWGRVFNGW